LKEGLKLDHQPEDKKELAAICKKLHKELNIDYIMATLSEAGIFISSEMGTINNIYPAHVRNISDVSGAGDTVISVASLCLALGLSPGTIAKIANIAGGLVCEVAGVVPVNKERLLMETVEFMAKKTDT